MKIPFKPFNKNKTKTTNNENENNNTFSTPNFAILAMKKRSQLKRFPLFPPPPSSSHQLTSFPLFPSSFPFFPFFSFLSFSFFSSGLKKSPGGTPMRSEMVRSTNRTNEFESALKNKFKVFLLLFVVCCWCLLMSSFFLFLFLFFLLFLLFYYLLIPFLQRAVNTPPKSPCAPSTPTREPFRAPLFPSSPLGV